MKPLTYPHAASCPRGAHNLSHLLAGVGVTPLKRVHDGEAVIVEVRRLVRLPYVLQNFRDNLPRRWRVTLLHGEASDMATYLRATTDELRRHLEDGSVRLLPLPENVTKAAEHQNMRARARYGGGLLPKMKDFERIIKAQQRNGTLTAANATRARATYRQQWSDQRMMLRGWYNGFLMTPEFWRHLGQSVVHVLLFEADAVLCPQPTLPLDWWAGRFGYVGSPWLPQLGAGTFWCGRIPGCCVGNSGLSLWNRPLMERLLTAGEGRNETDATRTRLKPQVGVNKMVDLWIAYSLQQPAMRAVLSREGLEASVPSEEMASAFAIGEPPDQWAALPEEHFTPIGVHGVHNWPLTRADLFGPPCLQRKAHLHAGAERCERLFARCPAIEAIALNASLDGEVPTIDATRSSPHFF